MFSAIYISLSLFDAVAETTSLPESDRWTRHGRLKVQRRVQSGAFKVWKQKEIHKKKKKKIMLHPWIEQRCLALYCTETRHTESTVDRWMDGWMEAERGSEVTLKGVQTMALVARRPTPRANCSSRPEMAPEGLGAEDLRPTVEL